MLNVRRVLAAATLDLERAGVADPRFEARYLLAHLLDVSPGSLIARGDIVLDPPLAERYRAWIDRRALREPAQHITGVQEFRGLSFACDARALVPRPETELVVGAVLALAPPSASRVLDVGTGSGCIAVTLALARPDLLVVALERSADALALARENARRHGVADRLEWVHADYASPPWDWRGSFAIVVSNPPYVSESEWSELEPEVREHDPREALVAGPQGLEAYAALVPLAMEWLAPDGRMVLELGFGQAAAVSSIVEARGAAVVAVEPDLRGIPRVLIARPGVVV